MNDAHVPKVLEDFYPCPVCLGIPLSKIRFQNQTGTELILDACQRCGGIWFDRNEVQLLRQMPAALLIEQVPLRDSEYMMPCHQCHQLMARNADKCGHCKHKNLLDCPICHKVMKHRIFAGLKLDFCADCEGVWFDNSELAQIWNLQGSDLPGAKHRGLMDSLIHPGSDRHPRAYDPMDNLVNTWIALEVIEAGADISWGIAQAAGPLAEATGSFLANLPDLLSSAPELLGGAVEVSGALMEGLAETGGSIFEMIADIIGSLFDN